MVRELQLTLERLRGKTALFSERYNVLRQSKADADARIAELTALTTRQQLEIERLTKEVEYLKIATTIVPNRDDVERSRAILSGLVREIDKCILELNE